MKNTKVEFWSDHIDFNKVINRNLTDTTAKKMAKEALESHFGDGDVFVAIDRFNTCPRSWETSRFCFVKVNGEIWEEDEEGNRVN